MTYSFSKPKEALSTEKGENACPTKFYLWVLLNMSADALKKWVKRAK